MSPPTSTRPEIFARRNTVSIVAAPPMLTIKTQLNNQGLVFCASGNCLCRNGNAGIPFFVIAPGGGANRGAKNLR